jgi:hypothetical protein
MGLVGLCADKCFVVSLVSETRRSIERSIHRQGSKCESEELIYTKCSELNTDAKTDTVITPPKSKHMFSLPRGLVMIILFHMLGMHV